MQENVERQQGEDLIIGRNAVSEALRSGRAVERILVQKGERKGAVVAILHKAKEKGIPIKEADVRKMDFLCGGAPHQGILAVAAAVEYKTVDDIFSLAQERGEAPFLIVADEVEDPHNLGAILRTAECAGAHGVIIPKRRAAGLTYAVGKASAGAYQYVPVARVTNIPSLLDELKERGVWVFGTDRDGEPWCKSDLTGPIALVVGSEGRGMGRLVREKCDVILSLPMKGSITSLNASVAAGIVMYEAARQRAGLSAK